jgi:hypothetical protein
MGIQLTDERMLYANLYEIERGLFCVSYRRGDGAIGKHLLPCYQVGISVSDAQKRIEQRARECGYDAVVWEAAREGPVMPRSAVNEAGRPRY